MLSSGVGYESSLARVFHHEFADRIARNVRFYTDASCPNRKATVEGISLAGRESKGARWQVAWGLPIRRCAPEAVHPARPSPVSMVAVGRSCPVQPLSEVSPIPYRS